MMYLLTRKNRVIDYCESGYAYVGNIVVCESKGCKFEDATIVQTDKDLPADIDIANYDYINGEFVRVEIKDPHIVVASSEDGVTYSAVVEGVVNPYPGLEITIIPNTNSTSKWIYLNVNGTGDVLITRNAGKNTLQVHGNLGETIAYTDDSESDFNIQSNVPCRLMYRADRNNVWVLVDYPYINGGSLCSPVPLTLGGTGAKTAEEARENLGAAPAYTYGTADLTPGVSELPTGTLYFVYE